MPFGDRTLTSLALGARRARPFMTKHVAAPAALLLTLVFAGCAGVPDAQFHTQRYTTQAAEFKTAWGPVNDRIGVAIVDDLKRKAGDLDILDRQIAIEQAIVGKPLVLGNRVKLLQDGPATYEAMFAAIRQAKQTINVEFYIIQDDEIGRQFAELLLERRAAGVQINVIYDSLGAFKTPKEYFERLKQAGINVVEFNPVNPLAAKKRWSLNHRDHRKLLVVDGRTAFLGGINIDDVYATSSADAGRSGGSGPSGSGSGRSSGGSGSGKQDAKKSGWRDTDIQIDGPVVADFQRLFLETWRKQKGPSLREEDYLPTIPPAGKEIVRAIGSTPDDPYSVSYLTFIAALTHAQKHVYIINAYFVPDPQLVEALLAAVKRGVDVRLILPSTTDSRSAAFAAHSHYTELLEGGVKIYERRAALLHAKTAVIDGVWSCVGSSNLDWRSAVDNDELNAVILSREFAQAMIEAYAFDQMQSDEIRLEDWKRRKLRDRVKELFFRLFARLL
jgi:cardiolipin synthase